MNDRFTPAVLPTLLRRERVGEVSVEVDDFLATEDFRADWRVGAASGAEEEVDEEP